MANLGLERRVKFLGFQRPQDVLPKMGLLVLTSISEALPLVLLEGYAAGLPVLATDVGSCRDLVYGASEEDRALGPSGSIVPIADPEAAATEAVGLLTDGDRWGKAQASAIARVERYYTFKIMIDAYRDVYEEALG